MSTTFRRHSPTCPACVRSAAEERDLVANTDPVDACPDCGKPADMGCHDLCPSDTPQLTEEEIGVAPW